MSAASVSTRVYPAGMLNTLSQREVERLQDVSRGELAELVRRCALAVLNSGIESDDAEALLLLTTTGRKSGLERTTPLVYMPHGDDLIVFDADDAAYACVAADARRHQVGLDFEGPVVCLHGSGGQQCDGGGNGCRPDPGLWRGEALVAHGLRQLTRDPTGS